MNEILSKTSKLIEKSENSGETNGKQWTRYVLKFEDFTGSTFDADLVKEIKTGEVLKVDYKKQGVYNNIVDLEKVIPEIKTANEVKEPISQDVWLEKDKRIVRQNCNERAIELMNLMKEIDFDNLQGLIKTNNGILNVAKVFAKSFEDIVWA